MAEITTVSNEKWTSGQAYGIAIVCLLLGLAEQCDARAALRRPERERESLCVFGSVSIAAKILLPAAGARGYGLAFLCSVLAGPLVGSKMPLHKGSNPEVGGLRALLLLHRHQPVL